VNEYSAGGGDTNVTESADPGWGGGVGTAGVEVTVYVTPVPVTAGHETVTFVPDKTAEGCGNVRDTAVVVTVGPTNAEPILCTRVHGYADKDTPLLVNL